ncbi:MAG: 16S rRNA (cytidine(1402)-2'-O)-methyltransferase [Deltaproteobacteria bacterium]
MRENLHPQESNETPGTLYVVGTPIGNLEDITLRALKVLNGVDLIAAENVAHTKSLCEHYEIKKRVTSYHQHNRGAKSKTLLSLLLSGKSVALVTDAGTPGISDPGTYLIDRAVKEAIPVTPIPGPSAVISALSVSGMPTAGFVFLGFLSSKGGKRRKELEGLREEARTLVFFESPHRLIGMLTDLRDVLGNRRMVLHKEMTKVFEEARRGRVADILSEVASRKVRGEYTLVVSGSGDKPTRNASIDKRVVSRIASLLEARDRSLRDIAQRISVEEGLPYRDIYKQCLRTKDGLEDQHQHGIG